VAEHHEEYLGDGLYVSFDGWHFGLRAPRAVGDAAFGDVVQHIVYLEQGRGGTLEKFLDYVKQMKDWQERDLVEAEKAAARARDSREGF
jgi:hypothetical protein